MYIVIRRYLCRRKENENQTESEGWVPLDIARSYIVIRECKITDCLTIHCIIVEIIWRIFPSE